MSDQDRQEVSEFVMKSRGLRDHAEGPGVLIRPSGALSAVSAGLVGSLDQDRGRPGESLGGVSTWVLALTAVFMVGAIRAPFPWSGDGGWRLLHGVAMALPLLIVGYLLVRAARARCQRDGTVTVRVLHEAEGPQSGATGVVVKSHGGRLNHGPGRQRRLRPPVG